MLTKENRSKVLTIVGIVAGFVWVFKWLQDGPDQARSVYLLSGFSLGLAAWLREKINWSQLIVGFTGFGLMTSHAFIETETGAIIATVGLGILTLLGAYWLTYSQHTPAVEGSH